jgi:hypothetical protein
MFGAGRIGQTVARRLSVYYVAVIGQFEPYVVHLWPQRRDYQARSAAQPAPARHSCGRRGCDIFQAVGFPTG